jgi:hypothetical protein
LRLKVLSADTLLPVAVETGYALALWTT